MDHDFTVEMQDATAIEKRMIARAEGDTVVLTFPVAAGSLTLRLPKAMGRNLHPRLLLAVIEAEDNARKKGA